MTNLIHPSPDRLSFALSLLLFTCLCSCSKQPVGNQLTSQPAQPSDPKVTQDASPNLSEVNQAIARVFKDAATLAADRAPNFLSADFNGDGSTDLAVILKPTPGKLDEMNQEFPPWILRDPFVIPKPGGQGLRVADGELLLAVIHGFGANGWRDAQATQTYVLKNSVGPEIKTQNKNEVVSAGKGNAVPRLSGDLISESLRGKNGYLYFNGAQYAWYDPQTFKGEAETRLTHPGMTPRQSKFDLLHPKLVAAEK